MLIENVFARDGYFRAKPLKNIVDQIFLQSIAAVSQEVFYNVRTILSHILYCVIENNMIAAE
jgi:hypothetical protein